MTRDLGQSDLLARLMKADARCRMSRLASRACDLNRADKVALADARTSIHDARIAFNVACGNDLSRIDRNGYTVHSGAR
jgi:hypothetical protein